MAFNLANALIEVRNRLQDQDTSNPNLSDSSLTAAVRMALGRLSSDRTAELIGEITGAATQRYELAAELSGWRDGLSTVRYIEYPALAFNVNSPPAYLDPGIDYKITEDLVSGVVKKYLYFPNHIPSATEQIRVGYTGVHSLADLDSATATSIPVVYEVAFYHLCAGYALQMFSNKMAQKTDSTINADVVSHGDLATRMASNARFWFSEYAQIVGVQAPGGKEGGQGTGVSSGWVDWDVEAGSDLYGNRGYDLLFHGRRGR